MLDILDLSEPLHEGITVVVESIRDNYEDPPFYTEAWATVQTKGYSVHGIHMGTHTGTHIDAPSHFFEHGVTIDQVDMRSLAGWALPMNFSGSGGITTEALMPFKEEAQDTQNIPLLISGTDEYLSVEAAEEIIAWNPKAVAVACGFNEPDEQYTKSQMFLRAGIPLIQRLDVEKANTVSKSDFLVAAPLRLSGMDGSPARVFVIRGLTR